MIELAGMMEQGNVMPEELAVVFLSELDGMIQSDIMLHAPEEIVSYENADQELILRPPHDGLYVSFLVAMIRQCQGEFEGYNNAQQIVEDKLKTFRRWYVHHYRPADSGSRSYTGGTSADGFGFAYLTAYGLAVKHGYQGSEEEWLQSLKGEEGDPGEAAQMRYDTERDMIQWGVGEQWQDLYTMAEVLAPLHEKLDELIGQAEAAATAAARSEEAARGAAAAAQSASGIAAAQANASKKAAEKAGEHQNAASLSAANAQASAQAAQKQAQQAAASATTAGNAAAAAQELAARAEAAAERAENAQGSSVSGGSVELDTTLTKSGKAADSKAVGDEIKRVEGLIPSIEGLAKAEDIPDVPSWALAADKPSYTKSEVGLGNVDNVRQYSASNPPPYPVESVNGQTGAVVLGAPDVGAEPVGAAAGAVSAHNGSNAAHSDIRLLIEGLANRLNALANSTDTDLDQLAEIVAYIKSNKSLIDAITTSKVSVSDIVNDLTTNVANRPLSAAMGVALASDIDSVRSSLVNYQPKGNYLTKAPVESVNGKIGAVVLGASDVGARPDTWVPTAQEVGADPKGTAASAVSVHNISGDAHSDLRLAVQKLQAAVDAFLDVDDTTRDSLSEVLALIDANADVIEAITTSKVSVSDIVNNLTTNVANRPLSAAQGVALKALFDKVPAWALAADKPSYTKSEVGLSNVDNVRQYSASNPPPYPVTSVNGQTGAVVVDVPTMVSQLTNDSKFISAITDAMITAALGYTPINPGKATLGRHEDGLLYLFVDGKPVGSGVELPTGGIDGYITEDKQIVFNNLPDGEYTLAYLMEDGSVVTIGELVKDTNTYYSVTSNLTNCTSSNAETQVVEGGSYSAVITANAGYELESVTVTMGGVDISSTAVSGGKITIAAVSGDIVVTAVAVEAVNTPGYTNLAKNFTSGRFNSSGAITTSTLQNSVVCEDYIPFEAGTTVRIKGLQMGTVDSVNHCVQFTNSSKVNLATSNHSYPGENGSKTINWKKETDEVYQYNNVSNADCTYMRVSGVLVGSTADVIITVNEEIIGSEITVEYTNLLPLATDTDGSLFVGPNGEAGYKPNTRVRMSNGEERTVTGIEATGFIPVKYKQTLYIKGITIACPTSETTEGLCFYNSSREFICGAIMAYAFGNTAGDVASCMVYDTLVNGITADADIAYARMSATEIGPDSIVTVNEPLE